jgi:aryl-alcohol dehydrogenase-like predicted oxidoreductase
MTFGTPVGEAEAVKLTHWAIDHGINFIDTANMYEGYTRYIGSPGGVTEQILGVALSRKHVLREIDRSLSRLQCEYVDLYYVHKPDPDTPLAESVQAFNDLINVGKVRYWAISNFSAEQISDVLSVCDENGWRRPVALQPHYSLLKRGSVSSAGRRAPDREVPSRPGGSDRFPPGGKARLDFGVNGRNVRPTGAD